MTVNENLQSQNESYAKLVELYGQYEVERKSLKKSLSNGGKRMETRKARLHKLQRELIPKTMIRIQEWEGWKEAEKILEIAKENDMPEEQIRQLFI